MPSEDRSPHSQSRLPKKPDEETLVSALQSFQPAPGDRFYKRMSNAPWNAAHHRASQTRSPRWRRPVLAAPLILVLVLFLIAILAPPSLRATAQRVAAFFIRSESDQTSVEITPVSPGQLDYDFNLTLGEAEAAAGYPVRVPQDIPSFLILNGAEFVPDLESVFLDYRTADSRQILRITQQKIKENEQYVRIGSNAEIEVVQIGDSVGEYVMGGWSLPVLATPLESAAPGVKITLEAAWNSEGLIQILRWQEGNMLFEIMSVTAPSAASTGLSKVDLVSMAEGMQ